jgi:hypothetical protein
VPLIIWTSTQIYYAVWRYAKSRMRTRVDNPFVFGKIIDPVPDCIPIRYPQGWAYNGMV